MILFYRILVILKNILRGVKLRSPKYAFKSTKPLLKTPKKFVPTSFWDTKNDFGINVIKVAFVNWNTFDEVIADNKTVTDPSEPRIQFKQFLGVGFNYSF